MNKETEKKLMKCLNISHSVQSYQFVLSDISLINETKDVVCRLKKYGYTDSFVLLVMKSYRYFFSQGINFKAEDMIKIAELVESILKCYGYDDEEIVNYFKRNNRIVLSSYLNFVRRLSIFNHFGYMDELIFNKWTLLTDVSSLFRPKGISELYAICNGVSFESLDELREIAVRTPDSRLDELIKLYPLTDEVIKTLNSELTTSLKKIKFRNTLTKSKIQKKNDGTN